MIHYKTYAEYLKHPNFRCVRAIAWTRANGKCENAIPDPRVGEVRCNKLATEVHHLAYCKWGEFDPPENLLVVCHECHCELHRCEDCGGYLKADSIKANRTVCFGCYSNGVHRDEAINGNAKMG